MPNLDIDHIFTYHPLTEEGKAGVDALTAIFKQLGHAIQEHCPDSAERMLALRKLQECRMWANTAIALAKPPA